MPRRIADGPTLLREACDMGEATFRQVAALEHAADDELEEPLASECASVEPADASKHAHAVQELAGPLEGELRLICSLTLPSTVVQIGVVLRLPPPAQARRCSPSG